MPKSLALGLLLLPGACAAAVLARFDPSTPEVGPFPTDFLTVPDAAQKTGERVSLPLPDCDAQPSACKELSLVNQFDGFHLNPRIRVRFSARVDTATLRDGVFFVALDNLTDDEPGLQQPGDIVRINQVIYDPDTDTAYAKPDAALDQHRRYAIVVTDAVRDPAGNAVAADPAFLACVQSAQGDYCAALAEAVTNILPLVAPGTIVGASRFTTLSATAWLESARAQLQNTAPSVQPTGTRSVFTIADISALSVKLQTGTNQFSTFTLPFDPALFSGLGRLAFASFQSPWFLNDGVTIDPAPTGAEVAAPVAANTIYFHAYLPNSPMPPTGYPVVMFGHGFGDNSFGAPSIVSPALARAGFATVAINAVGHGYGPQSTVTIQEKNGNSTTLPLGGRGVDVNGDGSFDPVKSCIVLTPVATGARDCLRQTALDLMQLVRAIQTGIDLDGDGVVDLDPGRIYYAGQSLGAIYGTIFTAVEPGVRAAALNVGGGPVVDIARLSPSFGEVGAAFLESRTPPLVLPGVPFQDNYVLRDQPVKVNDVPGAIEIQNYFETLEWLQIAGDPVAYAPHLKPSPLPGMQAKPVLWQVARGDQTVPNPASSNLIRAADMRDSTWLYRHDLARAAFPGLPANPHPYLALFLGLDSGAITLPAPVALLLGIAAQQQMADFFSSDGTAASDPNVTLRFGLSLLGFSGSGNFFEAPAALPDDLGF